MTFGGSAKGISFKDLLCGLVMLTNYRRDEKIKCENFYVILFCYKVLHFSVCDFSSSQW